MSAARLLSLVMQENAELRETVARLEAELEVERIKATALEEAYLCPSS